MSVKVQPVTGYGPVEVCIHCDHGYIIPVDPAAFPTLCLVCLGSGLMLSQGGTA